MRRKNPKFENSGERRSSEDDNRNSGSRQGRSNDGRSGRGGRNTRSSDNRRGSSDRYKDNSGDRKPSAGGGFGRREGKSRPSFDRDKRREGNRDSGFSQDKRERGDSNSDERPARRSFDKRDNTDRPERSNRNTSGDRKSYDKRPSFEKREDNKRSDNRSDRGRRGFGKRDGDSSNNDKKPFEKRDFGNRKSSGQRDFKDREKRSFGKPKEGSIKRSFGESSERTERKPTKKFEQDKSKFDSTKLGRKFRPRTKKQEPVTVDDGLIRLNKYIANSGICSRRQADEYIKTGLVEVNGTVITEMGFKVKPEDDVRFDGGRIVPEKKTYVLLNKPKGYITTTNDEHDRKTVMDLVGNATNTRLFPVGRLDRQTTGVLLFTNDGHLSKKLTHPSHNIKKIYHVVLDKDLHGDDMEKIRQGIPMHEGLAKVDKVSFIDGKGHNEVGVEIHIGWNRVVRRLFEKLGYKVEALDRVQFAGLTKKNVKRGQWRILDNKEVNFLKML